MSMMDDLLAIKKAIDLSRPKDHVDMILSTKCPIESEDGIRVRNEDKMYLILPWMTIEKIKSYCQRETLTPSLLGYTAAFGVPVVENENLVKDLLTSIHIQPDNGFKLSDEAWEWVFEVGIRY